MRKQDVKTGVVLAASRTRDGILWPVVLVETPERLAVTKRGVVTQGSPGLLHLASSLRSGRSRAGFDAWTEEASPPAMASSMIEHAATVTEWLKTTTFRDRYYNRVPGTLFSEEFNVVVMANRDLKGLWTAVNGERVRDEERRRERFRRLSGHNEFDIRGSDHIGSGHDRNERNGDDDE